MTAKAMLYSNSPDHRGEATDILGERFEHLVFGSVHVAAAGRPSVHVRNVFPASAKQVGLFVPKAPTMVPMRASAVAPLDATGMARSVEMYCDFEARARDADQEGLGLWGRCVRNEKVIERTDGDERPALGQGRGFIPVIPVLDGGARGGCGVLFELRIVGEGLLVVEVVGKRLGGDEKPVVGRAAPVGDALALAHQLRENRRMIKERDVIPSRVPGLECEPARSVDDEVSSSKQAPETERALSLGAQEKRMRMRTLSTKALGDGIELDLHAIAINNKAET